jgi:hypothetical protein
MLTISNYEEGEDIDSLDEDLNVMLYILNKGEVTANYQDSTIELIKEGELFSGIFAPEYPKNFPQYITKDRVKVFCLNQVIFDKLIFDYPGMAEHIIELRIKKTSLTLES